MYIRFVAPRALRSARADCGIFGPAYAFRDSRTTPSYLRDEIAREIAWFCDRLPVPQRFGVVTRKSRRPYAGICWFRDDARDAIAHADTLTALLGECDVPIIRIATAQPGDIVYRDDMQIVAMPRPETPVRWH